MAIPEEGLEDLKLDSFEAGYKAGWDDSSKAHAAEQEEAVTSIAQRLEDLSFTHAEAILKMNSAMQPLLTKITQSLLPNIAKNALGAHVVDQLDHLLKDNAKDTIEIAVAPDNLEPLQKLLEGRSTGSFKFAAEPMLTPGQVYLRANRAEREINLDAVQGGITAWLKPIWHHQPHCLPNRTTPLPLSQLRFPFASERHAH
jgi:flagellar assembly protein FliH